MGRDQRRNPFGNLGATEFARRVNTGSIPVIDRMGNQLKPEMVIIYDPEVDQIFEVVNIAPVLDPSAPQGLARVTLQATCQVVVPLGQPIQRFMFCGFKSAEAQQRAIAEATGAPVEPGDAAGNGRENFKLVITPGDEPASDEPPALVGPDGGMLPPEDEPPQ